MYRRAYTVLIGTAAAIFGAAFYVAVRYDRPLVEPEGKLLGPSLSWLLELFDAMPTNIVLSSIVLLIDMFFRAFSILLAALLVDLVVRAAWGRVSDSIQRARAGADAEEEPRPTMKERVRERWRTHWTRERMTLVILGTVCFYITYVCYRNLKSSLPFVRPDPNEPGKALLFDRELHIMDRVLFFGNDPSDVLHAIFGTNISAFVLSQIYLTYLPLVILLVAVWLVWSRTVSYGYWFVTSQVIAWTLGTLSYYLLPTLGPGIQYPSEYTDLVHTPTADLMESITSGRTGVLYDPTVTDSLNSVAGFASLHVAITLLWALMVQYTVRSKILHWVFWVNFGLTVIATLYFGWHYVADDIGGAAIAITSFYLGGIASGQKFDRGLRSHPTTTTSKIPINAD
ncbi:phosphatase PAP2 family protein [Nocardioides sambongensis]|uniref:phosphatase PAP2 family protein n=1 Tax=Nocardioides sambongensis TaxID=2589074 RepID=UPI001E5BC11A|nr:phosphatase PAP2 family protein [Nocardioides sambongensis]